MFTVFAIGFVAIYRVWNNKAVLLCALAYLYAVSGFLFDIIYDSLPAFWAPIIVNTIYTAGAAVLASGIQYHYTKQMRTTLLSLASLFQMAVIFYLNTIGNPWLTAITANIGAALVFSVGIFGIQKKMSTKLDYLLLAVCGLCIVQNVARPLLIAYNTAGPLTVENYSSEVFIVTLHLSIAVCAISMATTLFMIFAREAFNDVRQSSLKDGLTGISNRIGLQEIVDKYFDEDVKLPVSIVLADIDKFKSINDNHGHAVGDDIIIEFARLFERHAGGLCFPARIGGEEFVMVAVGQTLHDATSLAVAMRQETETLRLGNKSVPIRITASFGVSQRRDGEDLSDVLGRADEALYASKSGGRNRVTSELTLEGDDWDARVVTRDRRRYRPQLGLGEPA